MTAQEYAAAWVYSAGSAEMQVLAWLLPLFAAAAGCRLVTLLIRTATL